MSPAPSAPVTSSPSGNLPRTWRTRSVTILVLAWLILHVGGLFSPGLLDDVDSVYIEIAREMLHRHDFVTPCIDGIRFFDKPPLMYWLAAGSMKIFGETDWAARIPLALATLALLLATYALGIRLFARISPAQASDRGGFYAALALATSIGPYLYTRFFIPDILLALWMTLGVHLFLIALDRARSATSALLPSLGFAAVLAANLLTKGLIGLVFPLGFVVLYLLITRQIGLVRGLHLPAAATAFLALALPWHVLAALRNPAIPLPPGSELPARGGWAWFYLYNEHLARFFSRRVPHDYGQVPIPLFWLFALVWIFPWAAFLPTAIRSFFSGIFRASIYRSPEREAAVSLGLWAALVLGFFTISARQEYYSLPALPALALLIGGVLASADRATDSDLRRSLLRWSAWLLVPIGILVAAIAAFFVISAPHPPPGADIATLLAQASGNTADYNLSLSHLSDLTGAAMGLFRGPLALVGLSMLAIGPGAYLLRRSNRPLAANLTLASAALVLLLCVHEGLSRFYPTLGSKDLAAAIVRAQSDRPRPNDLILIDGELTAGSTLIFYTREPVHLVNGRVNGPWYGSFWPDAPAIFETDASLRQLWGSSRRLFLLTYRPDKRRSDLARFGPVAALASSGGKTILTNQP